MIDIYYTKYGTFENSFYNMIYHLRPSQPSNILINTELLLFNVINLCVKDDETV